MPRSPKSDPYRERFYAIEQTFGRKQTYDIGCTKNQARLLIAKVCRLYRIPKPRFQYRNRPNENLGGCIQYTLTFDTVEQPLIWINTAFNKPDMQMVLHELAHYIDLIFFRESYALAHGPTFIGICGWLYDQHNVIPAAAFRHLLRRAHLRFRPFHHCSPDAVRKHRARKVLLT